jgi:predicted kinase
MTRIHLVIDPAEREAFRAQAEREGRSLSEWLREAGRERLARARANTLRNGEDLDAFFSALDASRDDDRPEEDWEAVKARIARSRTPLGDGT